MSRLRFNWAAARAHLRGACPQLATFIDDFGPGRYRVEGGDDLFLDLAQSIAYQQLSGKAAATIFARFEQLFQGGQPDAARTLELGFEPLRSCGLSGAKTLAILDLAEHQVSGALPSRRALARMDDEQVIRQLSRVRGIGPWTVQMHLIFTLGRPDVMPATDYGVQKGVQRVYELEQLPQPKQVLEQTRHLAPYRSLAAWYFWRASEAPTGD